MACKQHSHVDEYLACRHRYRNPDETGDQIEDRAGDCMVVLSKNPTGAGGQGDDKTPSPIIVGNLFIGVYETAA